MTPQDVRDKRLEKAIFGGYDCGTTDNYLDSVAAELAAVLKENSILRSKMKILVEKIEEYRATEDAMKLALLSAQKLWTQIQNEAKETGEKILTEAKEKAKAVTDELRRNMKDEESRLTEARNSSALFIENMRLLCTKQLDFLDVLGETKFVDNIPLAKKLPESEPEPAQLHPVFEKEENAGESAGEPQDLSQDETEDEDLLIEFSSVTESESEDESPTKLFDFNQDTEKASARTQFSFETLTFEELEESV